MVGYMGLGMGGWYMRGREVGRRVGMVGVGVV